MILRNFYDKNICLVQIHVNNYKTTTADKIVVSRSTPWEGVRHYSLSELHDDVIKWKHFPRYWLFVRGIHRIPLTKASDAELWCFLLSAPEQTVKQKVAAPVIWDAIAVIMKSMYTVENNVTH